MEAAKIPYKMYEYDAPDGFLDGVSVAESLGQDPKQVFKNSCDGWKQWRALCVYDTGSGRAGP